MARRSTGDMSEATMMVSLAKAWPASPPMPTRFARRRRPISRTSAARSLKYGSSMDLNIFTYAVITFFKAYSALTFSSILAMIFFFREGSVRNIRWASMMALSCSESLRALLATSRIWTSDASKAWSRRRTSADVFRTFMRWT